MPTISLRGTIMSSTVMFSRSRMLSSIRWWRRGISAPASLTTVRSSSRLSCCIAGSAGAMPASFNRELDMPLVSQTTGYMIRSSAVSTKATGKAMRSGLLTAKVLGVTSPKISRITVSSAAATAMPVSPIRRRPISVPRAEAAMLTKLLQSRIRPIRRSGRSSSRPASMAPRLPALMKWRSRERLRRSIAVSAAEKNADSTIIRTRAVISVRKEMSSMGDCARPCRGGLPVCSAACAADSTSALQHYFQHPLAAEIGEQQRDEAAQGPADGLAAAPPETPAPDQQCGIHQPGDDGEDGLVGQVLGEDVVQRYDPGQQRQTLQREADAYHLEQQGFLGLERRQGTDEAAGTCAGELAVRQRQQRRLRRGDAEQTVGKHGKGDMQSQQGVGAVAYHVHRGEGQLQRQRDGGEREHGDGDVFHRLKQRREQYQRGDQPQQHGQGVKKTQVESANNEEILV